MLKYPDFHAFGFTADTLRLEEEKREKLKSGTDTSLYLALLFFLGGAPLALIADVDKTLAAAVLVTSLLIIGVQHLKKTKELKEITLNSVYDDYKRAIEQWTLTQETFWTGISGREFERRVAALFFHLGYGVILTPASNDGGVDVIISKDGDECAVQCKCHKYPTGPKDARELYGAMSARGYTRGMLINPSGFTRGVHEFTQDKPIELLDIRHLMDKAKDLEILSSPPLTIRVQGKGDVLMRRR